MVKWGTEEARTSLLRHVTHLQETEFPHIAVGPWASCLPSLGLSYLPHVSLRHCVLPLSLKFFLFPMLPPLAS